MTSSKSFLYRALHLKGRGKNQIRTDVEQFRDILNNIYERNLYYTLKNLIISSKRLKERYPQDYENILSSKLQSIEKLYVLWCRLMGKDCVFDKESGDSFQTLNCNSSGGERKIATHVTDTKLNITIIDLQQIDKLITNLTNKIFFEINEEQKKNNRIQSKHNLKLKELNHVQSANNEAQLKHNKYQKIANVIQGKDLVKKLQVHQTAMRESLSIVCDTLEVLFEEYVLLYTTFQYPPGIPPPYT
ncbi:hypothetical protein CAAN1_17S01398 [[Candida] anglica]|uniref:Uncharacterized protein n=1 Tax=[Candida] anglica TaxID=148631 RepID=A0ABP0E7J9_9ASCO